MSPIRVDEGGQEFAVSFHRCMVRNADGGQQLQRLDPPATRADLRERLATLGALPVAYAAEDGDDEGAMRVVTRDLRVKLDGGEAAVLAKHPGLRVKSRPAHAPGWIVVSAADALAALEALPALRATAGISKADVLMARQQSPRAMPNDPLVPSQWHLRNSGTATPGTDLNVETAWNYAGGPGVRGRGIHIGIVDDGLDLAHEDFLPNLDLANGWDWNGNDSNPSAGSSDKHGTACAGNAAARGNNGLGGSGVAPEAKLVGLRLISTPSTDEQEAEALVWKQDLIQVKSNSWGPSDSGRKLEEPGPLTKAALQSATTSGRGGLGTIFVWAAGNGGALGDNSNYDGYANSIHTIAVGAIDSTGQGANYSENGANVLICAPSDGAGSALGITTTDLTGTVGYNPASVALGGNYTNDFGGTSSATPLVAGVVALMLEKNPQLGWRDVQEILIRSAIRFRPTDLGWSLNGASIPFHPKFGAGLVNATAAVDLAGDWVSLSPQITRFQAVSSLGLSIPENQPAGAIQTFTFAETNLRVEHVTVTMDVSHSSRGNLQIDLISPSGTISRLAEVHNDTNDHISNWTFSTVHHWGEDGDGQWTLRVADLSSAGNAVGGSLQSATLRLYGSERVPSNPPPRVAIISPAAGTVFSPGSTLTVEVSADDLTVEGTLGTVAGVTLLDNGTPVATLTARPYRFHYVPLPGGRQLVATAIDSEGASASSPAIPISVEDRPPAITAVTLNAFDQAWADQDLWVRSVTAADPEGNSLQTFHQWQSSADGVNYQDAVGETSAVLPGAVARAGKRWRCQVRVSDGTFTSPPFPSAGVNLLARPALSVMEGQPYRYQSGLVLPGDPEPLIRQAIIHEFSQGPAGGTSEWVEILVLKTTNFGFWDLSDTTNQLVFNTGGIWSAIPAGTLIVIYNGTTLKDPAIPADDDDPADGRMVVSSTDSRFFNTTFDSWIPLSNSGDSISLNDASSVEIHSVAFGNSTGSPLNIGSLAGGRAAFFAGDTEVAASTAAGWQTAAANGAVTPGDANNAGNAGFVDAVRNGGVRAPARFRLASGSSLPAGLSLDPVSGLIAGTAGPASGTYPVTIERTNASGGRVSQSFVLTVGAEGGYEAWIAGFSAITDPAPEADPDADGLPNLLEYAVGSSPDLADSPVQAFTSGGVLSLIYPRLGSRPDVELLQEWSSGLGEGSWSPLGITLEKISESDTTRWFRATLPMDPAEPARFLRLKAFRVK